MMTVIRLLNDPVHVLDITEKEKQFLKEKRDLLHEKKKRGTLEGSMDVFYRSDLRARRTHWGKIVPEVVLYQELQNTYLLDLTILLLYIRIF